jgi:hypothetical protein
MKERQNITSKLHIWMPKHNTVWVPYANGQGVLQNRIKAHALWTLAAAQGDEDAINMLPILEKIMRNHKT